MNTLNDMSLYGPNLLSLLDLSEPMKDKQLMNMKGSLVERLPSISENQPFVAFNNLTNTNQRTTRFNDESPHYLSSSSTPPSSSSPTCTSLPANLADLTALLSQLNLQVNLQSAQEEPKPEVTKRHFKLSRSVSEPFQQPLSSSLGSSKFNSTDSQQVSNSANTSYCRYKTELCRPFEENGSCKYGEKCQFAHGKHELRSLARHPKYKTDLCKTYHTTGLCPYGPRCHFIHNDEERRLNFINRLVLEHKKQQAIVDQQSSILKQNQLLAAAVSAQKLCSPSSMFSRQMSIDTAISSVDQLTALLTLQNSLSGLQSAPLQQQSWQSSSSPQTSPSQSTKNLYQQLRQMSSNAGSLGSSGESPSSSIADSPPPSPTMIDDQFAALKNRSNLHTVLETLLKLNQSC